MIIKGQVLNTSKEERDLVSKDGTKKHTVISHVLISIGDVGKPDFEIVNLRGYDVDWALPESGKVWSCPSRVRKYENFDGNVAEVLV